MKKSADGRRQARVEKEVQQVVSEFIIHNLKNDLPGLVTVTRIQMPADLRIANVYVTYYNIDESKIDAVKILQRWASSMQDEIARQLKMRYCPKLTFFYDEATGNILKIEKILSDLSSGKKIEISDDEYDIDEED